MARSSSAKKADEAKTSSKTEDTPAGEVFVNDAGHEYRTSLPAEKVRLRGAGYRLKKDAEDTAKGDDAAGEPDTKAAQTSGASSA